MHASLARLALSSLLAAPALAHGETAKIAPPNLGPSARFGHALATDGGLAVVGAPRDDANGVGSGSAHVYEVATGQRSALLLPQDGGTNDQFGCAVAIAGGLVVVGAYMDDPSGALSGSAYLFDAATGNELAKLVPSDGWMGDGFGYAVATDGVHVLVSAPWDDDTFATSGSLYVFDAATGQELAKLHAAAPVEQEYLGISLAVDGGLAVVGSTDGTDGWKAGALHVFDVATGQELWKLRPGDGATAKYFGNSVALEGSLAVVGAPGDADNGENSGAAYLFDVATGQELAKLRAIDGETPDLAGWSVALEGGVVLVGAPQDDERDKYSGSAYLYDTAGTPLAKLVGRETVQTSALGLSVALSGSVALAGAAFEGSGVLYTFDVAPDVAVGTSYCGPAVPNSSGASGTLTAFGSLVVADDWLRLLATDLAHGQYAMFLNSTVQGFVTPPGSQGNLCLGGSIGRYSKQLAHTGVDGAASLSLDLQHTPHGSGTVAIQPGETWFFQAWFRDKNPGTTSNFSDGLAVMFL